MSRALKTMMNTKAIQHAAFDELRRGWTCHKPTSLTLLSEMTDTPPKAELILPK